MAHKRKPKAPRSLKELFEQGQTIRAKTARSIARLHAIEDTIYLSESMVHDIEDNPKPAPRSRRP